MKLYIYKSEFNTLKASYPEDFEKIKKLNKEIEYEVNVKAARNPEYHRKYFALLKLGLENTKSGLMDLETYRAYAIMKAGYYIEIKTKKGKTIIPRSISFEKMDNFEFEKLFNATINFVALDTEATEKTILNNIVDFM